MRKNTFSSIIASNPYRTLYVRSRVNIAMWILQLICKFSDWICMSFGNLLKGNRRRRRVRIHIYEFCGMYLVKFHGWNNLHFSTGLFLWLDYRKSLLGCRESHKPFTTTVTGSFFKEHSIYRHSIDWHVNQITASTIILKYEGVCLHIKCLYEPLKIIGKIDWHLRLFSIFIHWPK